jgi:hypothetical protein
MNISNEFRAAFEVTNSGNIHSYLQFDLCVKTLNPFNFGAEM